MASGPARSIFASYADVAGAWPRATDGRDDAQLRFQYAVAVSILRAGFVVKVNVSPLHPARLQHQLQDSGAKAIVIMENFAHTLQRVMDQVPVQHVVLASMGDMLGRSQGLVVNFVVRRVKKDGAGSTCPRPCRFQQGHPPGQQEALPARQAHGLTTSPCCSTPAAPPACQQGRRAAAQQPRSPTCCRPRPGISRPCASLGGQPPVMVCACRCITSSRFTVCMLVAFHAWCGSNILIVQSA